MSGSVGRPPTPPNLHLLRGDPSKLGKPKLGQLLDEIIRPPVEIPECPDHLSNEAKAEWARLAPHLERLGLVSQIDRAALAMYCSAWGDYEWAERRIAEMNASVLLPKAAGEKRRKRVPADPTGERGRIWNTPSGYKQISVLVQIRNRAMEMLAKFLADFGMSPAARSRVTPSAPGSQGSLPGFEKPQEEGWGGFK